MNQGSEWYMYWIGEVIDLKLKSIQLREVMAVRVQDKEELDRKINGLDLGIGDSQE
jgi:hypothetical protein